MSQLSAKSVSLLARSTNLTKEEVRLWHRQFLKECPGGRLCKDKFTKNYAALFPAEGDPSVFTNYIFSSFDVDGSGCIDFREFLMAVSMTSSGGGDCEEKLHWVFSMYDVDGDGTVDRREMESMLQAFHTLFRHINSDGDVSPTEKCPGQKCDEDASTRPLSPIAVTGNPRSWTREIFHLIDTNSDGVLTRQEFVEGCLRDSRLREWLTGGAASCAVET